MTTFEGMCIGFLAGVVGTLICVLGGALIDGYLNNHDSDGSDLPVGGRDRSCDNRQNNHGGGDK